MSVGGRLLESQRAGRGEAPNLCPDHKAFDDERRNERAERERGGMDGRERGMKRGSGHYLQHEQEIAC